MLAPQKLPPLKAANDRYGRQAATPVFVRLRRNQKSIKRGIALCLLLFFFGLLTTTMILIAGDTSAPAPVQIVTVPLPPSKAATHKKLTDIVLPASSLADNETQADDDVGQVAEQLEKLPALKGKHAVQVVDADAGDDAHDLLIRAHDALQLGAMGEARDLFENVLAHDADNHDALAGVAYVSAKSGDVQKAISTSKHLLQLYPHDAAAAANLAHVLMKAGKRDEAVYFMDRAARDAADYLPYRLELAAMYDKAHHSTEALMLYRQVLVTAEQTEAANLPLDGVRNRVDYLETLGTAPDPSTTRRDDN